MIHATVAIEAWALHEPFTIARSTITEIRVICVTLTDREGRKGWAEAAGVDYDGETPEGIAAQVEGAIEGVNRAAPGGIVTDDTLRALQELLGPGGARNALDCALWDLRAKQTGIPAWKSAGLPAPKPLVTVYTIGIGSEEVTRRKARAARRYPVIKIKCNATSHLDMVRWVRDEHPAARISVDANQSWDRDLLERILPDLQRLGVEMVEQPVKRHEDAQLDGLVSPLPLAADETCETRAQLPEIVGRYRYVNIKLDKTGGLTEALALADAAQAQGLELMVGNMCGTSLGMAPGHLIGQRCAYVDLDGPLLQREDRAHPMRVADGVMEPPSAALWG